MGNSSIVFHLFHNPLFDRPGLIYALTKQTVAERSEGSAVVLGTLPSSPNFRIAHDPLESPIIQRQGTERMISKSGGMMARVRWWCLALLCAAINVSAQSVPVDGTAVPKLIPRAKAE